MKKSTLIFSLIFFHSFLASCSFVASVGESTSDAGDGIVESTEDKEGFVNTGTRMFGDILRWSGDLATDISGADDKQDQTTKTVPVSQKAPAELEGSTSEQGEYGGTVATGKPVPEATNNSATPAETGFSRKPATATTVKPKSEVTSYTPETPSDATKIIRGPAEVYSEPSPFGDVVTMLPNGAQIKVITISGEWLEIKAGSKVGYLYKDLTDLVN